ncbi:hypothetical protein C1H46_033788 [Malus baccata]|uniref:Uncharacterized protein n=1 Tax=Malus baccata TaxID=106549 RepID=A0A540L2Y6_MALBA|nr:hypothetical protein C1H46_033788 [Malus baccata]
MLQMHFYETCDGQRSLRVAQPAGPTRPCLTHGGSKSAILVACEGLDQVERYDHHRGILS